MNVSVKCAGSCHGLALAARIPPKGIAAPKHVKSYCKHLPKDFDISVPGLRVHDFKLAVPSSSLNDVHRTYFSCKDKYSPSQPLESPSNLPVKSSSKKNTHYLNRSEDVIPRKRSKRSTSSFGANRTISRKSDEDHLHSPAFDHIDRWEDFPALEDLHDRIQDHAYRRMQIFYYLCTAYYGEGCRIKLGHTEHQHGRSKCGQCSAAHSSILPNVTDNFIATLRSRILESGLNPRTEAKMRALGIADEKIMFLKASTLNEYWLDFCFQDLTVKSTKRMISSECQFYDIMNSTVELPDDVNDYDSVIESVMREKALEILNHVSAGRMMPYEATKLFETELQSFFALSEKETCHKINRLYTLYEHEIALKRLEGLVWSGNITNPNKWTKEYLYTAMHARNCKNDIEEMKRYSIKVNTKDHLSNYGPILDRISGKCNPIETFFNDHEKVKQLYGELQTAILELRKWSPAPIEECVESLNKSRYICALQSCASSTPPSEVLFGKPEGALTRGHVEEKLFRQKLEILQRKPTKIQG